MFTYFALQYFTTDGLGIDAGLTIFVCLCVNTHRLLIYV